MEKDNQHSHPRKTIIRTIASYSAEVAIIFISITISFMFDEWRDGQNNKKQEVEFIESLLGDLKYKMDEVRTEINDIHEFILVTDTTFLCIKENKPLPNTVIVYLFQSYNLDNNFFNSATPTFNANTATENYFHLPDSLRRELFELYGVFDYLKLYYETVDKVRFDFKLNKMTVSNILNYHEMLNPDYIKMGEYMKSNESANNLYLIKKYELDKQRILKGANRSINNLMTNLIAFKKQIE